MTSKSLARYLGRLEEYRKYLSGREWKARRKLALEAAGYACQGCGVVSHKHLTVHHRNYERVGAELPEDLEVLCWACHEKADVERRAEAEERRLAEQIARIGARKSAPKPAPSPGERRVTFGRLSEFDAARYAPEVEITSEEIEAFFGVGASVTRGVMLWLEAFFPAHWNLRPDEHEQVRLGRDMAANEWTLVGRRDYCHQSLQRAGWTLGARSLAQVG